MTDNNPAKPPLCHSALFTRRSALTMLGTFVALTKAAFALPVRAQSQFRKPEGTIIMSQSSMNQSAVNEIGRGGVLVVAQWEAKEGKADAVVATLRRFLPQAQSEPGVKLFLIGQGKDNPAQFLFYELFENDDAFVAHQASEYFKSLIVGEALPLLSKRERQQYSLL
ncbi:MAG: putative quinol monooxygenase [Bradyrhizobium sp.]